MGRCVRLFCSLLGFGLYFLAAFWVSKRPELWTGQLPARRCDGPARVPRNDSGLRVISAGLPKTGSTSISEALSYLGLRTYKPADQTHFLPHIYKRRLLEWQRWGEPGVSQSWASDAAQTLAACRVDALGLEPHNYWLEDILSVSPDAKVVLSVRDFDRWVASLPTYGALFERWFLFIQVAFSGVRAVPAWIYIFELMTGGALFDHLREGGPELVSTSASWFGIFYCFAITKAEYLQFLGWTAFAPPEVHPVPGLMGWVGEWSLETKRETYKGWHDWVESVVPADRLLLFDVKKHGWAELCDFLDVPSPPAGTPFPRAMVAEKIKLMASAPAYNNPEALWVGVAVGLFVHLANFWILRRILFALLSILGIKVFDPVANLKDRDTKVKSQ